MENYNSFLKKINDVSGVSKFEKIKYLDFLLFVQKLENKLLYEKLKTEWPEVDEMGFPFDNNENNRAILSSFFETDDILEQKKKLKILKQELKDLKKKSAEKAK